MLVVLVVLVGILISMFSSTSLNADQVLLHQEENTNALVVCKQDYIPPSDLPMISGPFVGRQRDIESVTAKLHSSSTHTINLKTLAVLAVPVVLVGILITYNVMFSNTSLNADQVLLHQEENTNALVVCK